MQAADKPVRKDLQAKGIFTGGQEFSKTEILQLTAREVQTELSYRLEKGMNYQAARNDGIPRKMVGVDPVGGVKEERPCEHILIAGCR